MASSDVVAGPTISTTFTLKGGLHITQNAGTLRLIGTDHTYIEFYPDGSAAGRKAYLGIPDASVSYLEVRNQHSSGAHVKVSGGTVGAFKVPTLTTAQRDALTDVENADVIYNSTTSKLQVRAGGAWVDLH